MAYIQPPARSSANQIISADWNTYVKDDFIEVEARKEVDYVEATVGTSIVSTTAATANTIITANAFTPSGTDKYRIECGISELTVPFNAAGNLCVIHLYENATNLGRLAVVVCPSVTVGIDVPVTVSREFTPTNASKTYSIRAHRTNATCTAVAGVGGADVNFPIWMRITRLP